MGKRRRLVITIPLILLTVIVSLTSCGKKANSLNQNGDIITQTVIASDKIPVTVLVKNAFSINAFEKEAEAFLPNLDIIQVSNYTSGMGMYEYEKRLENSDITDIVMTWPLDVGEEYWEDELLDLSSMPYTSSYFTSALNTISKDGKLFYLPGPSQIRGIVYNKTLFKEKGWEVPANYDGFISLCKEIEASGIRSLQLGLKSPEVLDTAFIGYSFDDCYSTPEDAKWLSDYSEGKGSFGDHFTPALETFQNLIDEGVLQSGDLDLDYAGREKMLFNRKAAMVEDSVLLCRKGMEYNGCTDEFGIMPFFNPGEDADWVRTYPVCYIGLNKRLVEKENEEKYKLVTQLMEYISTPTGQTALAADTGAMVSSLKGTTPPDIPEIDDLLYPIEQGRFAPFPVLENAQSALRIGLAGMVKGTHTANDVIEQVDKENANPPIVAESPILGTATEDFNLIETGNFLTDAMRKTSGCDIALFLDNGKDGKYNGKGITAKIYEGNVTADDLIRVVPDLKFNEKGVLCKVSMTGENLINTLEYSISVNNGVAGWFYYFSGLKMEFDPTAEPGSRIKKITDLEGAAIDPKRVYSVAISDGSVNPDFFIDFEETENSIIDIFGAAISEAKTISPSKDKRFIIHNP